MFRNTHVVTKFRRLVSQRGLKQHAMFHWATVLAPKKSPGFVFRSWTCSTRGLCILASLYSISKAKSRITNVIHQYFFGSRKIDWPRHPKRLRKDIGFLKKLTMTRVHLSSPCLQQPSTANSWSFPSSSTSQTAPCPVTSPGHFTLGHSTAMNWGVIWKMSKGAPKWST